MLKSLLIEKENLDTELISLGLSKIVISNLSLNNIAPKTLADKSDRATTELVLDPKTRMTIFKMINRGLFDELQGCISAGKEANIYSAYKRTDHTFYAVKIYKTSILVFKDREKYICGEFRFRHGYNKSNPRKMVQLWAEKELRNLKRIRLSGIKCPEPILLKNHVLVMQFLGDSKGYASPTLKHALIESATHALDLYVDLILIVRTLFQICKLVHADLSEYNILYHQDSLWIIDVSQSVEHDHPYALEFLRKDCLNINLFFKKFIGVVLPLRSLFDFVVQSFAFEEDLAKLKSHLLTLINEVGQSQNESDDRVFLESFIPRTLTDVIDVERDIMKLSKGESSELLYTTLSSIDYANETVDNSFGECELGTSSPTIGKGPKKTEMDKEERKIHKKLIKAENRLRRQSKMKKAEKKRLCKLKRH